MKKNQSDGLTEAEGSRQMGRYKGMIFRRIFLCLHEGRRRYGGSPTLSLSHALSFRRGGGLMKSLGTTTEEGRSVRE